MPWLNTSESLTLEKLKGHVILLDFWTYCCINCIHVLDDLKYLEEKYKNDPFIVIGVHSPKFPNEKDIRNIRSAVARYEIEHPILVDSEMRLWKSYGIRAWPSYLLIGTDGKVISMLSGEGKRDELDMTIKEALEKGRQEGTIAKKRIHPKPDIHLESFLKFPSKLEMNNSGDQLFISDSNHNRILHLQLEDDTIGNVISIIGNGKQGYYDGSFLDAEFNKPQGLAFKDNKLFIADTENHLIREADLISKTVRTIAGTGQQGYVRTYQGNALNASLSSPWDLALDEDVLYIAMAGLHQIWKLNIRTGIIKSFAGSGKEDIIDGPLKEAALAQPSGLSLDEKNKKLYFADSEVSGLRYVDIENKNVKTLIGHGLFVFGLKNGSFKEALLQHPLGLEFVENKIFLADTYNHAIRIADLDARVMTNLIHSPRKGVCMIGDENCDALPLFEPNDLKYKENKLYITDTNNHLIRIYDFKTKSLDDLYILE
ncbi:MAG: redoxin domain-containing protein [Promethearchaeota archaeon]|nr:MAG: redoxin domain-containing protein [Candidatus Lokiarchaeota archaeon]